MMKFSQMNKKNKIILASLLMVSCITIGTLAISKTATFPLINTFSLGTIDTEIEEETGNDLTKTVMVTNHGPAKALIRAKIVISDKALFDQHFALEMTNAWEENGDYYYYPQVVDKGQTTEPLFTRILYKAENGELKPFTVDDQNRLTNPEQIDKAEILSTIQVSVYQEAAPTKLDGFVADSNKDGMIDNLQATITNIWDKFE